MDKLLPISVITSAITGDPESATTVLKHYRRYIAFLASRNGSMLKQVAGWNLHCLNRSLSSI